MSREFRTSESYEAEQVTRGMVPDFLRIRGFQDVHDVRTRTGITESQSINATTPDGRRIRARVKLCWRRRSERDLYSAAQLLAKIRGKDWEGTLQEFVARAERQGITHFLFVQRDQQEITAAALVPVGHLIEIWCAQRDISTALIKAQKLGRRTKNHAMNGSSPTLWLEDPKAPEVTAALWMNDAVEDLAKMALVASPTSHEMNVDDTFDDLAGLDYSLIGSDGASRVKATRSYVKRDQRVRMAVLQRAAVQIPVVCCHSFRRNAATARHPSGLLIPIRMLQPATNSPIPAQSCHLPTSEVVSVAALRSMIGIRRNADRL